MQIKKYMQHIFAVLLAFLMLFALASCTESGEIFEPTDAPTDNPSVTGTDITETGSPSPTNAENSPTAIPTLEPKEQVTALTYTGDAPTPTSYYSENFEGEGYNEDMIYSFSDVNVITTDTLGSLKSVLLSGGNRLIIVPDKSFTDGRIVLKFKMKLEVAGNEFLPDANFQYENEIFHVCADESGRIGSSNYYSSKFRILKEASVDKIRFFGYLTDINAADSMAYDIDKNAVFDMNAVYDIELSFEGERCYISINGGDITANFGNARDAINDFVLYARTGFDFLIDDIEIYEEPLPEYNIPANIQEYIDNGYFTGIIDYHATKEGVYLDRLTHEQKLAYGASSMTMMQSCVTFDVYTNAKNLEITYKVMESGYPSGWDCGFDVMINGVLQEIPYQRVVKNNVYTLKYTLPEGSAENNRVTVYFPPTVCATLLDMRFDENAKFAKVEKSGKMIIIGDSITEGSGCLSGAAVYSHHIARAYNLELLNQAVSGMSFAKHNIMGDYADFTPDYVFIANGTNNFAGGNSDKDNTIGMLEFQVDEVVSIITEKFPNAKIFGLAPIYREDEIGANFNLRDVSDALMTYYAKYENVTAIDCYNFCPGVKENFFGFMLHPSTIGHNVYGENLLAAVNPYIGEAVEKDWQKAADEAMK